MGAQRNSSARAGPKSLGLGDMALKLLGLIAVLLLVLSLISHHPEDTHILADGVKPFGPIRNWIGRFGALVSTQLFGWIGFAAYPAALILAASAARRATSRKLKPVGLGYFGGILCFILGAALLLGVFPGLLPGLAAYLNIARTPGGVIGQRFCAPESPVGWMSFVVNPVGSVIISGALLLLGLGVVWYWDWMDQAKIWWRALRRHRRDKVLDAAKERSVKKAEAPPSAPAPAPVALDLPASPDPQEPKAKPRARPAAKRTARTPSTKMKTTYKLPPIALLEEVGSTSSVLDPREIAAKKQVLQDTLDSFGIDAGVGEATSGPRVTLFEIKPAAGVKVEKISSLANNIAMNLKAESLRILTPIPGKDTVGIEVPNHISTSVPLRELLESSTWKKSRATLPIALGKDISGKLIVLDLAQAPHLLIAGATGSGKSVCMNALIISLLYRFSPLDLKVIMVDPKVVEFAAYSSLPHLVTPVISDVKKVPIALRWILNQMEWRYKVFSKVGVRNIAGYNSRPPDTEPIYDDDGDLIPERVPYLVLIIDELADIMMTSKADVETSLARIAQLARAVGIHAVIATQRPSVNIITGIIKANFPTRIAFQVSSVPDSRTILDTKGAESLLGRGDMLFKAPGGSRLERTQGALVNDPEITNVVSFVSEQAEPVFIEDVFAVAASGDADRDEDHDGAAAARPAGFAAVDMSASDDDRDEDLIQQAIEVILRDRRATTSHLQRRLRVGYNRASLIIEELEQRGIVGPQIGQNPREILITGEDLQGAPAPPAADADAGDADSDD